MVVTPLPAWAWQPNPLPARRLPTRLCLTACTEPTHLAPRAVLEASRLLSGIQAAALAAAQQGCTDTQSRASAPFTTP